MVYNVGLIGLGNIGATYDLLSQNVMSHLKAIQTNRHFFLKFGYDQKSDVLDEIQRVYTPLNLYSENKVFNNDISVDLLVIATPTNMHLEVLEIFLPFCNPRLVLCEKPLTESLRESFKAHELCMRYGSKLYVNYMRRSLPEIKKIRSLLRNLDPSENCDVVVRYSGTLINNGSHFIDLLNFFFAGDFSCVYKRNYTRGRYFALLVNNNVRAYLIPNMNNEATEHEVTILTSSAKYEIKRAGRRVICTNLSDDTDFTGLYEYGEQSEVESNYLNFMSYVYDDVSAALSGSKTDLCEFEDSVRCKELMEEVLDE